MIRIPSSSKYYFITCIFPTFLLKLFIIYLISWISDQMPKTNLYSRIKYNFSREHTTNSLWPYLHHKDPCEILSIVFSCFCAPSQRLKKDLKLIDEYSKDEETLFYFNARNIHTHRNDSTQLNLLLCGRAGYLSL